MAFSRGGCEFEDRIARSSRRVSNRFCEQSSLSRWSLPHAFGGQRPVGTVGVRDDLFTSPQRPPRAAWAPARLRSCGEAAAQH